MISVSEITPGIIIEQAREKEHRANNVKTAVTAGSIFAGGYYGPKVVIKVADKIGKKGSLIAVINRGITKTAAYFAKQYLKLTNLLHKLILANFLKSHPKHSGIIIVGGARRLPKLVEFIKTPKIAFVRLGHYITGALTNPTKLTKLGIGGFGLLVAGLIGKTIYNHGKNAGKIDQKYNDLLNTQV